MKWIMLFLLLCFHDVYAKTELECMTEALYFEARGEGKQGLAAVGSVILNRVESPLFPNSVCGVVYQYKQFSYTLKKKLDIKNKEMYSKIKNIAHLLLHNDVVSPVGDALYYHATRYKGKPFKPWWADKKEKIITVKNHIFYRRKS